MENKLITVAEAARIANVSVRHMYYQCNKGEVVAAKIGNVWRVNRDKLLEKLRLS